MNAARVEGRKWKVSFPKPGDPPDLEIREIRRVVDDSHQIGFAKANAHLGRTGTFREIDNVVHGLAEYHTKQRAGACSTTVRAVPARRHLPVVQPPKETAPKPSASDGGGPEDDAIETRPPWHWVGFGTVAIFAGWLPLAYAAQAAVARVLARRFGYSATAEDVAAGIAQMPANERFRLMALLAIPNAVALGLASFGGGYLIGRFGASAKAGSREAAMAGGMTALVALVLALGSGTSSSMAAVATSAAVAAIAVGCAALGGRRGGRRGSQGK